MKAPFKPGHQCRYLAVTGGLALALSLMGVLPATAQSTTNAAPAAPAPPATNAATTASAAPAADQELSPPEYTNWVTLGIGSTFIDGDKAQYQREQNTKDGVFGGVEDFHMQQFVGKNGTFTMDGHALVGNHDYDLKLDLTDPTLGYLRAGYTEYRIWYDGNGGYYPPDNESFSPYSNDLYVDRRCGWVEAGLTLPDLPAFSFRYEYDSRTGLMDSTEWGDNDNASATLHPTYPPDKKIVPTYLGIDETRNIFQGDVKDKVSDTDMGLTLRYELDETKDSTFEDLDPLDGGASNPTANGQRYVTDYNIEKNDIFSTHGFQETFFDSHATFSSGFSYVNTGTDLGGIRVYGAGPNSAYNLSVPPPKTLATSSVGSEFFNLGGLGNSNEYVGNINLMLTPVKDLVFISAVRAEYDESDLADAWVTDAFVAYNKTTKVPAHYTFTQQDANSTIWNYGIAESQEVRYTGFNDWSLYASGEWSEDWGNDSWNGEPVLNGVQMNQNWGRLCQKYTIGANWYPLSQLNFGTQYYHQTHDYEYNNRLIPATFQYPGFLRRQDITTDDMNFRATWQALSNVSLVTRYDFQQMTVDTTSDTYYGVSGKIGPVGTVQSCNVTNHILSENATWTPLARLYLQVGGSYTLNTVDTPLDGMAGYNNLVPNAQNNYWTLDASAGYALDDKTDLRLQYDYYRADDYFNNSGGTTATNNTNANSSLPYGADTEEHNVTATITRQINKSLQVSVKYGFSQYRDGTSGGQDNYDAQLVYASLKYGF